MQGSIGLIALGLLSLSNAHNEYDEDLCVLLAFDDCLFYPLIMANQGNNLYESLVCLGYDKYHNPMEEAHLLDITKDPILARLDLKKIIKLDERNQVKQAS